MIILAPKREDISKYQNATYGNFTIKNVYRGYYDNHLQTFFDLKCNCGNEIKHISKSNFFRRKFLMCPECRINLVDRNINLEELIDKKYNNLTIINAYRIVRKNGNKEVRVDCICDCGEIRKNIQFDKLRDGIVYSCRKCAKSISSMEIFISQILKDYDIKFIFQHKFNNCRDIFELPFDFYLPKSNILIEYDGSQHFEKNHFNNSEENFEAIKRHDKMKTIYANQHNIKLIRFNYKQTKDEIRNELLSIIGCENRKKY